MKAEHKEIIEAIKASGLKSHRVVGRRLALDSAEVCRSEKYRALAEKAGKIVSAL